MIDTMNNIDPRYKIAKSCFECQAIISYHDRREINFRSELSGLCPRCKAKEDAKKEAAKNFDMEKGKREYEAKNNKN